MVSFLTKVLWILYGVAFSRAVGQLFVAGKEQTSGLDGLSTGRELISQKIGTSNGQRTLKKVPTVPKVYFSKTSKDKKVPTSKTPKVNKASKVIKKKKSQQQKTGKHPSKQLSYFPSDEPSTTFLPTAAYYNIILTLVSDCAQQFKVDGVGKALKQYHEIISDETNQGLIDIGITDVAIESGNCVESGKKFRRNLVDQIRILEETRVSRVMYVMVGECTGQCPEQGISNVEKIKRRRIFETQKDEAPLLYSLIIANLK